MGQQSKLGTVATKVHFHGNVTYVTYHSTDVVVFDKNYIKLDTGGWFTSTTKTRMNQASRQFDLGFSVYQKDFRWFVVAPDGCTHPFGDRGISFTRI